MPDARRKLTELDVEFISLVATPANGKALVLKSGAARVFALKAGPDEQMRAYGIVYAPGEVDSQGDTADAATILRAANGFMRQERTNKVDLEHSFRPEEAFVAESWIVRKSDPLFPEQPDGAWAVGIQVGDPEIWRRLKSGELTGLSLAGNAMSEALESDGPVTKGWLADLFSRFTKRGDPEMTDDDVRKIAGEVAAEMMKAALEKAGSGDAKKPEQPPVAAVTKADLETLRGEISADLDQRLGEALKKGAGESGPAGNRQMYEAWGLI